MDRSSLMYFCNNLEHYYHLFGTFVIIQLKASSSREVRTNWGRSLVGGCLIDGKTYFYLWYWSRSLLFYQIGYFFVRWQPHCDKSKSLLFIRDRWYLILECFYLNLLRCFVSYEDWEKPYMFQWGKKRNIQV
jgi:hypothetical protein